MKIEEIVELLAAHRTVGKAPREELLWIAEHGTYRHFQQGELVARQTEVVDGLHFVITGRMAIYTNRGTGMRKTMEWAAGDVTGLLPYSRMTTPPGDTIVEEPSETVSLVRADLPGLIQHCHEVTSALVHVMTDRARRFTSTDLRDEKMISLGKLAAGFAHEVNNPASAVLRNAKFLVGTLSAAEEGARALWAAGLDASQLTEIDAVWEVCISKKATTSLSGLELADREDVLGEWLKGHGMSDAFAADLAKAPVATQDLDRLAHVLKGGSLDAALRWIAGAWSARSLASEIERAATRIHTLVTAAKGFTHMDRAPVIESVEISAGLADTVALLEGKARAKMVTLALDVSPDVPPILGYGVEINQIWMNLIDNAIDAAPERGHVGVTAILEGAHVIVTVVDDGPGIPAEIKQSIFDPFFTTKPVGEGTGLGLDIVRRVVHWHNGDIAVDSRPGRTEFRVKLPIAGGG